LSLQNTESKKGLRLKTKDCQKQYKQRSEGEVKGKMSEAFVADRHFETVDAVQLSHQPTVDMGTPVDLLNGALRLDGDGGGVVSADMPPLFRSDDIGSVVVKSEICGLKPVDSMPHLMPMVTDTFPIHKKDDDTENWVPMVR